MFLLLLLEYVDPPLFHKRPLIIFRVNFAPGTSAALSIQWLSMYEGGSGGSSDRMRAALLMVFFRARRYGAPYVRTAALIWWRKKCTFTLAYTHFQTVPRQGRFSSCYHPVRRKKNSKPAHFHPPMQTHTHICINYLHHNVFLCRHLACAFSHHTHTHSHNMPSRLDTCMHTDTDPSAHSQRLQHIC